MPPDAGGWGYDFLFSHRHDDESNPFEDGLAGFPGYCQIQR